MEESKGERTMQTPPTEEEGLLEIDISTLIKAVMTRWRLVAGICGTVIVLALAYCFLATPIYQATCRMLDRYRVHYCIESFDPRCLIWLKKNRPEIVRGQLSEQFLRHGETAGHGKAAMWLLGNLFSNVAVRPDFIAYRFSDRDNLCLRWCRKFYHVQEINWTIRTKEEMEAAEAQGNLVIFECFDPKG